MTTRARLTPDDGDLRHGTINGYSNLKCRCAACKTAWADYCLNLRNSAALPPDDWRHGQRNTYLNYACRCDACRLAARIYRQKTGV